jgi:hypothetical protein
MQGRRVLYGEQCGSALVRLLPFDWKAAARTLSPEKAPGKDELPPYFPGQ